jgi:hypothetical protein
MDKKTLLCINIRRGLSYRFSMYIFLQQVQPRPRDSEPPNLGDLQEMLDIQTKFGKDNMSAKLVDEGTTTTPMYCMHYLKARADTFSKLICNQVY